MGDAEQPISQARTRQQSDDAIGEGMKSWDEISEAVNVTNKQTQLIDETAKIFGVRRWKVLERKSSAMNGHSSLMTIRTSHRFQHTRLACLRLYL